MTLRVAINGFGRMGRLALRQAFARKGWQIVLANDPNGQPDQAAHLLVFDSVHGRWPHLAEAVEGGLRLRSDGDGAAKELFVEWSSQKDLPAERCAALGVDLVLECSGKYRTLASLEPYFTAGVPRVLVSAPVDDPAAANIVMGINHETFNRNQHRVVTAASCTTNALAPIVKTLDTGLGLRRGAVTTLHSVTNTQVVIDRFTKDWRRSRSASTSMIPTTTGSASAIGKIFPHLKGRLHSVSIRVPLQNASMIDGVFEVERETSREELGTLLAAAAAGPLRGILGYEERPLVSIDFLSDARSSIVDAWCTQVIGGHMVKVIAWYDNEWGYVARMLDLAEWITTPAGD